MLSAGFTFVNVDQVKALDSVPYARRKELPDSPGLYFAVLNGSQVGYIGVAKSSLRRRWKEHNRQHTLRRLGTVEIAYLTCDDLTTLLEAEHAAIRRMRPLLNFQHVEGALEHWREVNRPKPGRPTKQP